MALPSTPNGTTETHTSCMISGAILIDAMSQCAEKGGSQLDQPNHKRNGKEVDRSLDCLRIKEMLRPAAPSIVSGRNNRRGKKILRHCRGFKHPPLLSADSKVLVFSSDTSRAEAPSLPDLQPHGHLVSSAAEANGTVG